MTLLPERFRAADIGLTATVGLVALGVYVLTLSPGVVPGASAALTAQALGLLPSVATTHPFAFFLARMTAHLPFFEAPVRLNLLSAVCGAVAVAWLFRVTRRFFYETIREKPDLRSVPCDEADDDATSPRAKALTSHNLGLAVDRTAYRAATLGAAVAAVAFAFCAPFWIASVSLHTEPVTFLLLMVMVDLLADYVITEKTSACFCAMLLLGIGLVESVVFVVLFPLAVILVILASIRFEQISERFTLKLLAMGGMGFAANLSLFVFHSGALGIPSNTRSIFQHILGLARAHWGALVQALPASNWIFVLLQLVLPLLIAHACLLQIRNLRLQSEPDSFRKYGCVNALASLASAACLLNLPKSAWSLAREGVYLPVAPCLTIAIAAGACLVFWQMVVATQDDATDPEAGDDEPAPSFRPLRSFGRFLCALLGIAVVWPIYANLEEADGRQAVFADRIAGQMLEQSGKAQCLIVESPLALNLLIRNHLTRGSRTVIPGSSARDHLQSALSANRAAPFQLRLAEAAERGHASVEALVEQWLRNNPDQYGEIATVGNPGFWLRLGYRPLPCGFTYHGFPQEHLRTNAPALARSLACRLALAKPFDESVTYRPELSRYRAYLRAYASRMANDAGVLYEQLKDPVNAEVAYEQALQLDPNNFSACLNRYGVSLRRAHLTGSESEWVEAIWRHASRPAFFDTFDTVIANCGALAPQDADILMPAFMRDFAQASHLDPAMARLLERWLDAFRVRPTGIVSPAASHISAAHEQSNRLLLQAAALWLAGQGKEAERQLRLVIREAPSSSEARALLAEILLARGDVSQVEQVILPAMAAADGDDDSALTELTRGSLLLRKGPPHYADARACFYRAFVRSPELPAAGELLLRADLLLGHAETLEADARLLIAHVPTHAGAHALLGSLRLSQKRYEEAELHLRQSLNTRLTVGALNDLAELLRLNKQTHDAEQHARKAIRLMPSFYQAWDTLGNVLLDQGRISEAADAVRCACTLEPNDARLLLTHARLRIEEGDLHAATQILSQISPSLESASPSIREARQALQRQLESSTAASP